MSLLAPDDVAPSSGANRLPIRHSTYLVHPGLQAFFYHSEQEMSDPFAAQKEILWRAERAVQEPEREIIEFRRRCEAYEKFLHDQLAKDKSLVAILKEDIAGREKSVVEVPHEFFQGTATDKPKKRRDSKATDLIRSIVKETLVEQGGTLSRAEIKSAIESKNLVLDSRDLPSLIRAALKRDPTFEHVPNVGYRLSSSP